MRLHELSITAFGPFVDTVVVDFDELTAGGLFLLTGDTGAGKTSVLDAVAFALYGEVPGDRHQARHLRSDHAPADAEPRVVLSLSVRGRTFRFTRSPAWERPKRRGDGTVRVQAHVVVEELHATEWTALTTRLDEAGQLVAELLGMTCTQFTQVAMLPQGRFQTFLRATSAERHAVLQRLFRTRRFEEVERWLGEQRLELGRSSQLCRDRNVAVVNRLQEAAGTCVPEQWDLTRLDLHVEDRSLETWVDQVLEDARCGATTLQQALEKASGRLESARADHEHGRARADARLRGERSSQVLSELEADAPHEAELARDLDAHRRAASVLPVALRAEQAIESERQQRVEADQLRSQVLDLVAPSAVELTELTAAATQANQARAVAESWLPRESELHDERARCTSLEAQLAGLAVQLRAGEDERLRSTTTRERLLPLLAAAKECAVLSDQRGTDLAAANEGLAAAEQVVALTAQLQEARTRLDEATTRAHDLREQHLDIREHRISGMAAELATALTAGCSCPVCGSAEHPAPARSASTIGRAEEDAARQRHEDADFERQTVRESVTALEVQLTGAVERSQGKDVDHWGWSRDTAAVAFEESELATRRVAGLEAELATLHARDSELAASLARTRALAEARAQQHAESVRRCEQRVTELETLLGDHPRVTSVAALVELHGHRAGVLEAACQALGDHERAIHELEQAVSAANAAAVAAGFASLDVALAAVLPGERAASSAAELEERRDRRAAATAVLDDADVSAALADDAPDLTLLARDVHEAGSARDELQAAHRQAATRQARLLALREELHQQLAAWEPVRTRHAVVAELAALVEGKSADNQLKMRLSAYVLSERLRQVVAAANERLGAMTDARYTLEQADEKGAGEQRGGLSLRVRDEWSGKQRDPATLSGGETFLVSLALALGLADTVTHEAGGTQLDTLFIDEGFGALDAATLDGVMDTLDSLRDGGRVVGLVSHVAELRNRVPAQLEVRKARRGATLHLQLAHS